MIAPGDPRHGTYAGYQAHARPTTCGPCLEARRRRDRAVAYEQLAGHRRMTDATTAREHLAWCLRWGMRLAVFENGGVPSASQVLRTPPPHRIYTATETRILAITPKPGVNCWPAFSAIRRLRALVALGHQQETILGYVGSARSWLSMLINDTRDWTHIDPDAWRRIDAAYRDLCMTPGPCNRARARAEARGWVPPLAWDDIDDPDETPHGHRPARHNPGGVDHALVERLLAGERLPCTHAEKVEVAHRWARMGWPLAELERLQGWKPDRYVRLRDLEQPRGVAS